MNLRRNCAEVVVALYLEATEEGEVGEVGEWVRVSDWLVRDR